MTPRKPIYIIDDDEAVRKGLKFLLRSAGYAVETFATPREFLDVVDPQYAGCLILDIQMPSMSGLELQRELNCRGSRISIIFITGYGTVPLAIEAMKAGASDLIEKPIKPEVLLDRVERAFATGISPNDRVLRAQLEVCLAQLTAREREVLLMVAAGDSSKVIAQRLGISFRTVEVHRAHLTQKLHARGRSDLVRLASIIKLLPA